MTPRHSSPPPAALRLLAHRLPADERDMILGDLTELFADRVEAGRPLNRLWFWVQAVGFVLGFATAAAPHLMSNSPHERSPMFKPGQLLTSLRQAIRRLRFEWRYASSVVLILAIGIGPATAMLSIVRKVLLQPLAYASPDRLGLVRVDLGQLEQTPGLTQGEVTDLQKMTDIFVEVESAARRAELSFGPPDHLTPVSGIGITPAMLPMLGVSPILGRELSPEDFTAPTQGSAGGVVLVDYGFWQGRLGGATDIVGRTIRLNGRDTEVVGVLPQGFRLTTGRSVPDAIDVYMPLRLRSDDRNFWAYTTIVRLKDGVTFARANAALATLAVALKKAYPEAYGDARLAFHAAPLLDDLTRQTRPALRAAMGGVLLLLVIALANATALAVARIKTRERDFAIRVAVGAGRGTLVAEVLLESLLLGACGALAGAGIAAAGIRAAQVLMPHTVPRWDQLGVGWELLAYSCGFALAGLGTVGLLPLWRIARGAPWQALREGAMHGGRAEGTRSRLLLAGAQVALTVVLVFGAAQLMRSAARLNAVTLGFNPNVLTFRVPFDGARYDTTAKQALLYQRIRDRLRQVPGVTAVGAASHLPLSGSFLTDGYTADLATPPGWDQALANYYAVTPGYLAAAGISIREGRDFTDAEDRTSQKVIVVDETLARAAFPGRSALGQTLKLGWGIPNSTIVGVTGSVRGIDITRDVRPQIYVPYGDFPFAPLSFAVRASGDPLPLLDAVKAAVNEVGTGRALSSFSLLQENVAAATGTMRAVTNLVTSLAITAGVLSAIGLYAVIAYVVYQRRRSTAIRSALGASRAQLVWHHLRTSGSVMLVALPIGAALAAGIAPLFASLVYGLGERDVTSLAIAVGVAGGIGILGNYVPIRRAANTNPVVILRGE